MNAVIIVAAGTGKRMGPGKKKIYRSLGKATVLYSVVAAFHGAHTIDKVVLVISANEKDKVVSTLKELYDPDSVFFASGGSTRQESVLNGLRALEKDMYGGEGNTVLIHDAARPWVSEKTINDVVENASVHGACAPVISSSDALKTLDSRGTITSHLPRENTKAVQTPQGFSFAGILDAHLRAAEDGFPYIDDTEIYGKYVGPVYTIEGEPTNRKITYPHDLAPYDFSAPLSNPTMEEE